MAKERSASVILVKELGKLGLEQRVQQKVLDAARLLPDQVAEEVLRDLKQKPRNQSWIVERFIQALR